MKHKLALTAVVISLTILFVAAANHAQNLDMKELGTENASLPDNLNVLQEPTSLEAKGNGSDASLSGPESIVPWLNNQEFRAAQEKNNAFIQMAAYRTVLRDPLPGEENNVHLAARMVAGTVVAPGEVFSQNLAIGPYSANRGFQVGPVYIGGRLSTTIGGGVCKMASTLYNVAVLSDLPIVERYAHGMPVPYVPYGQDATVSYGMKDIKFRNNTSASILIWAQGVENTLYVGFYGQTKPPQVTWHHQELNHIAAQATYRINKNLLPGQEKTVLEGMDGAVIQSWVELQYPDGTTKTKNMGISYYNPMPAIVERNPEPTAASVSP